MTVKPFHSESGKLYTIHHHSGFMDEYTIWTVESEPKHIGSIHEAQEELDGYDLSLEHTKNPGGRHIGQTNHIPVAMKWIVEEYEKEWEQ